MKRACYNVDKEGTFTSNSKQTQQVVEKVKNWMKMKDERKVACYIGISKKYRMHGGRNPAIFECEKVVHQSLCVMREKNQRITWKTMQEEIVEVAHVREDYMVKMLNGIP